MLLAHVVSMTAEPHTAGSAGWIVSFALGLINKGSSPFCSKHFIDIIPGDDESGAFSNMIVILCTPLEGRGANNLLYVM